MGLSFQTEVYQLVKMPLQGWSTENRALFQNIRRETQREIIEANTHTNVNTARPIDEGRLFGEVHSRDVYDIEGRHIRLSLGNFKISPPAQLEKSSNKVAHDLLNINGFLFLLWLADCRIFFFASHP